MKIKTYTLQQVLKQLKTSPFMMVRYKRSGLIKQLSRGVYEADGVDKLTAAKNDGYSRLKAAKLLKVSKEDITNLSRLGFLVRIYPEYARSNYTTKSVEYMVSLLAKNGYAGRRK